MLMTKQDGGFVVTHMELLSRTDLDSCVVKEIQALKHLRHPLHCPPFWHHLCKFNVLLFLHWHEMSLRQYLAQKPAEEQAKHDALCILKGLGHMHQAGYVHRDLKPDNTIADCQPLVAVIADLRTVHLGEDGRDLATT